MPDNTILSEMEMAEIEAILELLPDQSEFEELIGAGLKASNASLLLRVKLPALCQTVRALRAENEFAAIALKFAVPNQPFASLSEIAKQALEIIDSLRTQLASATCERDARDRWLPILETVINQAQPATAPDDNPDHYLISRESLQSIVKIHQELANEQGGLDDHTTPRGVTRGLKRIQRATNPLFGRMKHGGGRES